MEIFSSMNKMGLREILSTSTFGAEFELCVCMYDMLLKYHSALALAGTGANAIPPHLLEGLPEDLQDECERALASGEETEGEVEHFKLRDYYFALLNRCGEGFRPAEDVHDYSEWGIENDGSIHCGFGSFKDEWADDESMANMLDAMMKNETDKSQNTTRINPDRAYTKATSQEGAEARQRVEVAKQTTGIIVPVGEHRRYLDTYAELCETNMFGIEVVSKKYMFPQLKEFQDTVCRCIYNDEVVYQHNTSQGLHISIGNSLTESLSEEERLTWLGNFVNLWWKFELSILRYVPSYRSSVSPGTRMSSHYAVPLHSATRTVEDGSVKLFSSSAKLNATTQMGVPGWVAYYARDEFGGNIYGDRPKYTAMNIKGLVGDIKDGQLHGVSTDKVFVEFRMLPATEDIDTLASWITLLSCMSTICLDEGAWRAAMAAGNLKSMFPPELEDIGQESIEAIARGKGSEVLISYSQYEGEYL
jgi:hypothetical protein